ncbi:MAG: aminoacyl-tRNA hydrolase [Turicibacter sp.]
MKLFVGLGNPGSKYERTRHNAGFLVIDELSKKWNIELSEEKKFKGLVGRGMVNGEKVILLKPTTFMNLSGESVRAVMDFYEIDLDDMVVIYDDLDLPQGKIRLRLKGSAGGHNGIKSIIAHTKTQEFKRIKVGIDRHPKIPVVDYVLGRFTEDELAMVMQAVDLSVKACEMSLKETFNKVMTEYSK